MAVILAFSKKLFDKSTPKANAFYSYISSFYVNSDGSKNEIVYKEIKNYLNTSPASQIIQDIKEGDYLYYSKNDISYTFNEDNKKLLISIANNPQYNNIKNDFIIWGQTKTMSGVLKPIKYHLAFDKKPEVDSGKIRLGIIYKSYNGLQQFLNLEGIDQNSYYYFNTNKEFLNNIEPFESGKYYLIREWR